MLKKKIALLIGQGDASYQRTLIRGVTKELLSSKYELHIFTNFHTTDLHTDVDPSQISGETSIFHMVPFLVWRRTAYCYANDSPWTPSTRYK